MTPCPARPPSSAIATSASPAHIDAGKTTTTERILFYTGVNHKIGEVHDGAPRWTGWSRSRSAASPSPRRRRPASGRAWTRPSRAPINIIDTPGHVDFTIEVERSDARARRRLHGVLRGGRRAASPRPSGARPTSTRCRARFVNKMDRTGANFFKVADQMKTAAWGQPVPSSSPDRRRRQFQGRRRRVQDEAIIWDDGSLGEVQVTATSGRPWGRVPGSGAKVWSRPRPSSSEELMNKYLEQRADLTGAE